MNSDVLNNVILCTGGCAPGVHVLDVCSNEVHQFVSLKKGESVYTSDISPNGKSIVVGTKAGHLIYLEIEGQCQAGCQIERFFMAAPVLSVRFVNDFTIVAVDMAGKILLWDREDKSKTRLLGLVQEPICSLFCPGNNLLAGVSTSGKIYLWPLAGYERPCVIQSSEPPIIYGLVNCIDWNGFWVWSDHMGRIVQFNAETKEVNFFNAHSGAIYAICTYNGKLVTLGKSDGLMKFWKSGHDQPARSLELSSGAVSLSMWQQECIRCLVVNENGHACIYNLNDKGVQSIDKLEGTAYRTAIGPDPKSINSYLKEMSIRQVEQLSIEIKRKVNNGNLEGLDLLYQQLDGLGSHKITLWLGAYQAEKQKDVLKQLKRYQELYNLLESKERQSPDFLKKYVEALRCTWQLNQAIDVLENNIIEDQEIQGSEIEFQLLYDQVSMLSKKLCIIDSNTELITILKASQLFNNKIKARILYKKYESFEIDKDVNLNEFAEKYEIYRVKEKACLPKAVTKKITWLKDDMILDETVILLHSPNSCFGYVVKKDTVEYNKTVVTFALVLNTEQFDQKIMSVSTTSIDLVVEANLKSIQGGNSVKSAIRYVIQQYITQSKSLTNIY